MIFIKNNVVFTFFIKNIGKSRLLIVKEDLDLPPHFLGGVSGCAVLGKVHSFGLQHASGINFNLFVQVIQRQIRATQHFFEHAPQGVLNGEPPV